LLRKRKPNPTLPQTLKIDGKTINSSLSICQELNEHFVKIGEKLSRGTSFPIDKSFTKNLGKQNLSSIVIHPTNKFEISSIIDVLNSLKSTGYIDIPISLIKDLNLIPQNLANVFNKCLEDGIYQWWP